MRTATLSSWRRFSRSSSEPRCAFPVADVRARAGRLLALLGFGRVGGGRKPFLVVGLLEYPANAPPSYVGSGPPSAFPAICSHWFQEVGCGSGLGSPPNGSVFSPLLAVTSLSFLRLAAARGPGSTIPAPTDELPAAFSLRFPFAVSTATAGSTVPYTARATDLAP